MKEMDESALARRILDASLALIDEGGLASLSMREVARRAGVSHQAPYHHFADRQSILAEIAREGFDMLDAHLTAGRDASSTLRERMRALGVGYVRFALDHPAHFRVMFRPDLVDLERFADAKCSGDRAFRHVRDVVNELLGSTPEAPHPEEDVWASILWSSGHGLACLILDGPLAMKIASSQAQSAHVELVFDKLTEVIVAATAGSGRASTEEPVAPKKPRARRSG
jgi:AcrR family transcriptional regulator